MGLADKLRAEELHHALLAAKIGGLTRRDFLALAGSAALGISCGANLNAPSPLSTPEPSPSPFPSTQFPLLVTAGDIASQQFFDNARQTAALVNEVIRKNDEVHICTTGDNVYMDGTLADYEAYYTPTWGPFKERTRPSRGNHDGSGYFTYFGSNAGPEGLGYYGYSIRGWHLIALNSNFQKGSSAWNQQLSWLKESLEANRTKNSIAYWHHPLFSSGKNGDNPGLKDFWDVLYQYRVDIVLNGHDHLYERFAKQNPDGLPEPQRGIRQFTVGTGGYDLYDFKTTKPTSESRGKAHGILLLYLKETGYDWEFRPIAGQYFTDSGSDLCNVKI